MAEAETKRGRGRLRKPGMVTKSLRLPEELFDQLEAIASEQNLDVPFDRPHVMWTDVARDFLQRGVTRQIRLKRDRKLRGKA